MPERNPREWRIEMCSECGCYPEWCVCDECEIERVHVVEVLWPPEAMLAWALRHAASDRA